MPIYKIKADDEEFARLIAERVRQLDVVAQASRAYSDVTALAVPADIFDVPPYQPPDWLIEHYVAAGHLVTLIGEEGLGKGLLSIRWSADLIERGYKVLWMSTEDDDNEVKGRLSAAGWTPQSGELFHVEARMAMDALAAFIVQHGISLVIMDAGRDFMTQGQSNNDDASVRPAMLELRHLAKSTGAAILFIHHTNKATVSASGKALSSRQRSGGAAAFMQVPRHNLMLERNKRQEIGLGVVKSNISTTGRISLWEKTPVTPYGMRLDKVEELEDQHFTLDQWRADPSNDPDSEDEIPTHLVDDMVLAVLRGMETLPGARNLFNARLQSLMTLKFKDIGGCYTRLEMSGQIVRRGNKVEWA